MKKGVGLNGRDGVVVGAVTIVASVLLKFFVLDACRIASPSMEPSLLPGDYVFFSKVSFSVPPLLKRTLFLAAGIPVVPASMTDVPRRGDIVVFDAPIGPSGNRDQHGSLYVKRCVGLPGDTVSIRRGVLRVNRTVLISEADPSDGCDFGPYVVPSKGSRITLDRNSVALWLPVVEGEGHHVADLHEGDFSIDDVPATAYVAQRDYLFVLGDNLGDSSDSRSWGPLPLERVLGKAIVTYWSRDPDVDGRGFFDRLTRTRWDRVGMLTH